MNLKRRNNVNVTGSGSATLVFSHGFGCDQNMWRLVAPAYEDRFRVVLFDSVGSGDSDKAQYDHDKYSTLHGYADDLLELVDEFASGPVIHIGHSVAASVGMLASIKRPNAFAANIMVGPSPCFVNEGDYVGGFSLADIEELLSVMEENYLGWSSNMAPAIMGAVQAPELRDELMTSFCRNDPEIAKHFARVTFLSDHRADVPKSTVPTLILQCSDDMIAPLAVGDYLHRHLPNSVLKVVDNVGHCPHMSAPSACSMAIDEFMAKTLR